MRIALVLLAAACAAPPSNVSTSQPLSSDVRLRLVAANLTSGNNQSYDSGEGLRILEGLHPDVVMVQEFNLTSGDFQGFANSVCGQTCYFSRETLSGSGNLPNGVVSKYPIKSSGRFTDSSVSNRGYEWAQIDIPGTKDLWVFSLHLLTNTSAHAAEGSELVNDIASLHIPSGDWIAVGGDFNSSSSDAAISALSGTVVTTAASPIDQNSNANTNGPRSKHYDWVFVSSGLNALETAVAIGANGFPAGLVADTRVYTPIADLSPALATDSGATNMQHMAIVKDFLVPGDAGAGASITVTAPNGGESWPAGSTQNITWTASGVTNVKIEYSSDGGATYATVAASVTGGTYAWTVPSAATANGKVRISDTAASGASDVSNAPFTIVAAPPGSDAFEPDDTAAAAKAIALGTPQTHSIQPATDQDWMTFTLAAPTNVRIATSGPLGADTVLYLYGSSQSLIASDDDSGPGYYSLILRPALAAGTYYVKVASYAGHTSISNYSVSVASY